MLLIKPIDFYQEDVRPSYIMSVKRSVFKRKHRITGVRGREHNPSYDSCACSVLSSFYGICVFLSLIGFLFICIWRFFCFGDMEKKCLTEKQVNISTWDNTFGSQCIFGSFLNFLQIWWLIFVLLSNHLHL